MKLNKRNKSNKLVIPILILSLLFISIGYSYLRTTLSIDGNVSFDICMKNTHKVTILGQTMTYYDDDKCSEFVSSKNGIRFDKEPSDTNGKGLYLRAGTENDSFPIYYYRGGDDLNNDGLEDFINNHVLFGGFCWKIVRTTEKGGTKLIYDGLSSNGQCNNTGTASQISVSVFNIYANTLADIGYMYGTRYDYTSWNDTELVYGSDVSFNGGAYTLTNASPSDTIANIKTKHYTCRSNGTTCDKVYYIYSLYYGRVFAILLTDGKIIDNIIAESFENRNDSAIKTTLDTWFEDNLLNQESKLEDAVWCNDRSIARGGYLKDSDLTAYVVGNTSFEVRLRHNPTVNPLLKDVETCKNKNDRFTVNDLTKGNGVLRHSIGLLTADELKVAGENSYLNTEEEYWLLSSHDVASRGYSSSGYLVDSLGQLSSTYMARSVGVRPSIVLKHDIVATSGEGSSTNPYVVE